MKRFALGLLVGLALATLLLPDDWFPPAFAQDDDFVTNAKTLDTDAVLAPFAGLDPKTYTLAKKAPKIDIVFFAGLKDHGKGTLWSSWGDGCLHSNGNYYTSVGDHLGIDANCYIYEYNPVTKALRRVVDVLRTIMHMLGLYGHGKVHSGIHEAADGSLYFSTYWGKHREIDAAFTKGFNGSIVLRHDPKTGTTENLGAIVPKQGLPASHFDSARQRLFFHAVYKGDITVFDLKERKVLFQGGGDSSAASRTFIADAAGNVYFSGATGTLHFYDPVKNGLVETKAHLPGSPGSKKGDTLRAAAQRPAKDGTLYGMTAAGRLFAFDPVKHGVRDLGPNIADGYYNAVMAISPDDKYLYYTPGSHGSNVKIGTPIVQFEIATGKRKVLAFLSEVMKSEFKYTVGGTYNLQLAPGGDRLFITFNGAPVGGRVATFGQPCVAVLHIPAEER